MSSPQVPEIHRDRRVAESFGGDAERYDRARPDYPGALVRRIIAASPGRNVLDVGCGTGIEARQFRAAGCTVLGVEPDARMADVARRRGLGKRKTGPARTSKIRRSPSKAGNERSTAVMNQQG